MGLDLCGRGRVIEAVNPPECVGREAQTVIAQRRLGGEREREASEPVGERGVVAERARQRRPPRGLDGSRRRDVRGHAVAVACRAGPAALAVEFEDDAGFRVRVPYASVSAVRFGRQGEDTMLGMMPAPRSVIPFRAVG